MRVNCCRTLPILIILSGLLTATQSVPAATTAAAQPSAKPPSAYPQIVRLSYVEGDVRISRGKLADKEDARDQDTARPSATQPANGGDQTTGWEPADANLPLESGYSLVTGKGRAEIEFEDASTVYLADNSVLTFDELSTTGGVPTTRMALLSGTATLDVRIQMSGDTFLLTTPTDYVTVRYPQKAYLRVDSYLDAVSLTPQQDLTFHLPGMTAARPQVVGQTMTLSHARRLVTPATATSSAPPDWDIWVADRVEARETAMSEAMKAAGLTAPVPGLDALNGQGKFFACQPYGTCWEPANGWVGKPANVAEVDPQPGAPSPTVQTTPAKPASSAGTSKAKVAKPSAVDTYMASHPGAILHTEDYTFPCMAYPVQDLIATDPVTGKEQIIGSSFDTSGWPYAGPYLGGYPFGVGYHPRWGLSPFWGFDAFNNYYPWDWAVCHAGSWIRWQHHYVWVAGSKRHHHRPIHWVKTGGKVGFVPIHPRDVAGKPPVNLKEGVYRVTGKKDLPIERVGYDEHTPLKLLDDAPREFRKPDIEPLKIAEVPQAMAHSVFYTNAAGAARSASPARGTAIVNPTAARGFAARDQGTPINFDRKSQTFSVARPVIEGGRPVTVNQTLGGGQRGGFQGGGSSNNGGGSRASGSSPSYGGGGGSRPSAPAPSYGGGGGGGGYSHPSAPAPSAPSGGGGASNGSSSGGGSRPK